MVGLIQPLKKRQGLHQTASPHSTRHNMSYVIFLHVPLPLRPLSASTGLTFPLKEKDLIYMPAYAGVS